MSQLGKAYIRALLTEHMPKDTIKEVVAEYWSLLLEGIVTAALLSYFMQQNFILFIIGFALIVVEILLLVYSLVKLQDPKLLITFILSEWFMGDGK